MPDEGERAFTSEEDSSALEMRAQPEREVQSPKVASKERARVLARAAERPEPEQEELRLQALESSGQGRRAALPVLLPVEARLLEP